MRRRLLVFLLLAVPSALAADTVPGFVTLLPPSNVIGDGSTPVDLYFMAVDPKGEPIGNLKLVPYVHDGTLSALEDVGHQAAQARARADLLIEQSGLQARTRKDAC